MQQPSPIIQLKCPNPQCGRLIKVNRPAAPGRYNIVCPGCGAKLKFTVPAPQPAQQSAPIDPTPSNSVGPMPQPVPFPPQHAPQPAPRPAPQPIPQPAPKPAVNNQLREPKERKGDFLVGRQANIACAFDCGHVFTETPPTKGTNMLICPVCKGRTKYEAYDRTMIISNHLDDMKPYRGKLVMLRKGWFNKSFKLHTGQNVIGRYDVDPAGNSDIAITDDPSMSRRSINIAVSQVDGRGFQFLLEVLRATNPVLVNHEQLITGETLALNYGDCIILGKTRFRFEQDV